MAVSIERSFLVPRACNAIEPLLCVPTIIGTHANKNYFSCLVVVDVMNEKGIDLSMGQS
jgi:hypothetical protein